MDDGAHEPRRKTVGRMAPPHGPLRRYRAIAIDVGDQDRLQADTTRLHEALDRYGIKHEFEIYPGTHTSKVADRFQNHVMKFFGQNLCAESGCR